MDHYTTLGINRNASPDDIKQAYRRMANQHHPDRGGSTAKFQEVQAAYETLSDPGSRQQYDNPQPQGFHFGGVPQGFEDAVAQMFGGGHPFANMFGGGHHQQARNRTLNLQTDITLEEAFLGKNLVASIRLPSGLEQVLEVRIPSGVNDGTVIRLSGIGDDAIKNMPRGDIHLSVRVQPHHLYQRQGDDLIRSLSISCFDSILGKAVTITTLDNKQLDINIAPGTQHGQTLAIQGHGMPNMQDNRIKGRMLLEINISIPNNLTEQQKNLIRQIVS